MKLHILLLCGLFLGALAHADAAEVYKWRDTNGVIRYSDTPPPSNVKQETYRKKAKVATKLAPLAEVEGDATVSMNKDKAADKASADKNKAPPTKEEAAVKRAKEAEELKKIQAQKKAELEIKTENCKISKANLATFANGGRMSKTNEKGERSFLSDADIAKGRVETEAQVQEHCNGL